MLIDLSMISTLYNVILAISVANTRLSKALDVQN